MAYEDFYAALREDTGKTATTLPDPDAEAKFEQAAEKFGAAGTQAGARVLVLRADWAKATDLADYTQNEESERLGQIAAAKRQLLDYWEGKLAEDTAAAELPKGRRPALFQTVKASNRRWYP